MATPYPGSLTPEEGFDSKNNIQAESLFDPVTGTQTGGHITGSKRPCYRYPNWRAYCLPG